VLEADVPHALKIARIAAVVIAASMIAHSSTDVPVARWLARKTAGGKTAGDADSAGGEDDRAWPQGAEDTGSAVAANDRLGRALGHALRSDLETDEERR
jgi:hypothetical protein